MSPVFGHGRLRLYLLKLLAQQPRHGYEMIRLLEDHFEGMYAPSAGTIYPRLARLEREGLVAHSQERGRKVYHITDAGREELARRQGELEALEEELDDSAASLADLAREIHEGVRDTVQGLKYDFKMAKAELKQELKQAGWDVAAQQWERRWGADQGRDDEAPRKPGPSGKPGEPGKPGPSVKDRQGQRFERLLGEFGRQARRVAAQSSPTEAQLAECVAILDEAVDRLRHALARHD